MHGRRLPAAALLALLFCASSAGCTLVWPGGSPNSAPAGNPSPVGKGLEDYRFAFHVHCNLSHDSPGTVQEIAAAAQALGLDGVIFSDHYAPGNIARSPRGLVDGILFVPGVELRGGGGSILSFGLQRDFQKSLPSAELLQELERQGCVNVIGHAESITDWDLGPFHAFEVYNLHAEFREVSAWNIAWRFLFLPPDSFFERAVRKPEANLAAWDRELRRGRRLAPLAGHDAHANVRIFGPLGGTLGTYQELFRLFSNHILARELSADSVLEAVKAGRTYVCFDFLADGTGFSMTYGEPGDPAERRALLGGEADFTESGTLHVALPAASDGQLRLEILRDGERFLSTAAPAISTTLPGPGAYRAEAYLDDRLWILSAPIHVLPPVDSPAAPR